MKRALITVATLGILASAGWVVEANAQANIDPNVYPRHMSERYGYRAPAYGPSRRYARRAYRRSARQTYRAQTYGGAGAPPTMYSGNTAFTPGSGPPPYAASTSSYFQNESERRGSWIYPALCSRIHITYSATATAKTANAMEKAACLRMVIQQKR